VIEESQPIENVNTNNNGNGEPIPVLFENPELYFDPETKQFYMLVKVGFKKILFKEDSRK